MTVDLDGGQHVGEAAVVEGGIFRLRLVHSVTLTTRLGVCDQPPNAPDCCPSTRLLGTAHRPVPPSLRATDQHRAGLDVGPHGQALYVAG